MMLPFRVIRLVLRRVTMNAPRACPALLGRLVPKKVFQWFVRIIDVGPAGMMLLQNVVLNVKKMRIVPWKMGRLRVISAMLMWNALAQEVLGPVA
jgi:hypothetical protein